MREKRKSWDNYFMEITELVATRSTCIKRKIGAILVKDKRILTTGYNEPPSGFPDCTEEICLRLDVPSGKNQEKCWGLHAEQNAVIQAALMGISVKGSTLYCTHQPCSICAKILVNAGIKKIIFKGDYPDKLSYEIFKTANIPIKRLYNEG